MERSIKNAFIDKNNLIYLVDEFGILYLYEDKIAYPFPLLMENIQNCFFIDNYYVHSSKTIKIFNEDMYENDDHHLIINNNIDKVCYCHNYNIIVTLESGEVYINFIRKYARNVKRMNINQTYQPTDLPKRYHDMKILDNILLLKINNDIDIFYLDKFNVSYMQNISLSNDIYNNIFDYDVENSIFYLLDGNILSIDNNPPGNLIKQIFFQKRNICLFRVTDGLLCYVNNNSQIVAQLQNVLESDIIDNIIECKEKKLLKIILPTNRDIRIIDNNLSQLILFEGKTFLIKDNIYPVQINYNAIFYEKILAYDIEKNNTQIIIDVIENQPIIDQLINIIPSIYRFNNEMNFLFHQIDLEGNVISYGIGVSRQIYYLLRKEIDDVLKDGLVANLNYFKLGNLIYFCNREGRESYFYLHPYFFFKLAKESDYEILIKIFRTDDFDLLNKQFHQYLTSPDKLQDLGIDIETIDQYVEYIISSNISDQQKKNYDELFRGFFYFAHRHKFHSIIMKLPVNYYCDYLIAEGTVKPEFTYLVDKDIEPIKYEMFCKYFDDQLSKLTIEEMVCFIQNITGSQFYMGKIKIILSNPGEQNYTISTCFAELRINVEPTESNIKEIIQILIIEDLKIKN